MPEQSEMAYSSQNERKINDIGMDYWDFWLLGIPAILDLPNYDDPNWDFMVFLK